MYSITRRQSLFLDNLNYALQYELVIVILYIVDGHIISGAAFYEDNHKLAFVFELYHNNRTY